MRILIWHQYGTNSKYFDKNHPESFIKSIQFFETFYQESKKEFSNQDDDMITQNLKTDHHVSIVER